MSCRIFSGIFLILLTLLSASLYADDLVIEPGDAYVEFLEDSNGFNLYIKALPGLGSVLITESTADPKKKTDSFAFRTWDYNPTNGDEKRILDGKFLVSETPLYFLLDSTPEPNEFLGSAYKIYIPYELTYGYPWSREGQVEVRRGTWLNVRTFSKKFADYSGAWKDNPFILSMKDLPPPRIELPSPPQIRTEPVRNAEDAVNQIGSIVEGTKGDVDIGLVLDTTISMKNDMHFIRRELVPAIRERVKGFQSFRIGIVLYRDYKEAYLTRTIPFMNTLDDLQKSLDSIEVAGGRDIPEAVDEGIYTALSEFDWESPERIIIQIGDADGHEVPRGAITSEMVQEEAKRLGVEIFHLRLPGEYGR